MRPIEITMSAFGPYAGEINLNMLELGEKGLYLITGDTGAGKTTIFDAICFALFGEASGGSREAAMLRSKYADADTPTFVDMSFAHGGKEYHIRRNPEYMRPAKRGDGLKKELPNAELTMPDGSVITKVKDVNAAVVELLGIDRGQFSQIAMLAQGDFLKLLLAETKERQEIFRKLFKTEFYQTLQNKLDDERKKSYIICQDAGKSVKQYVSGIVCEEEDPLIIEVDKAKAGEKTIDDTMELIERLLEQDYKLRDDAQSQIDQVDKELAVVNQNIGSARQLEKARTDLQKFEAELETELPHQEKLSEARANAEKELPKKDEYQKQQAQIEAELPKFKEYEELLKAADKLNSAIESGGKAIEKASAEAKEIEANQETLKKELLQYQNTGADREKLLSEKKSFEEKLERIQNLEGKIEALLKDEKKLEKERENYKKLDLEYQEKNIEYERVFKLYRDGQAGVLAATLEEGQPCPVCGSTTHPAPALLSVKVPTDAELKDAKRVADEARESANNASKKCGELGSSFDANCKNARQEYRTIAGEKLVAEGVKAGISGGFEEDEVCNSLDIATMRISIKSMVASISDKLSAVEISIKSEDKRLSRKAELEETIPTLDKKLLEIKEKETTLKEKLASDKAALEANQKQSKSIKEGFSFENRKAAEEKIEELAEMARGLQSSFDKADKELKECSERINVLKGQIKGLKETVEKEKVPELETELSKKQELEGKRSLQTDLFTKSNSRIEANEAVRSGIEKKQKELSEAEKKLSWITALADTANGKLTGKEKIMLETYIQTTYFDRIISRANLRFMKMSDAQYELKRLEEAANNKGQSGLDLGVIDHYNGTSRSVKTLSGGESFMAALSLALGLSDEIQSSAGGIQIDTMFVDEGFGTLDSDSLELAYNALAGLTEGNRLVGIISHVTELKDKIDKQIVVTKEKSGGSKAQIIL